MEILFENVYTDNKKMMLELYNAKSRMRYVLIIFCLLMINWYILQILIYRVQVAWIGLALTIVYMLYELFVPIFSTRRYLKNVRKYHDGVIPQHRVQFTEKEILVSGGRVSFTLPYDKLDKMLELKLCTEIRAGKMAAVCICPDSFTKGSYEELKKFLLEKNPNIKVTY